MGTYFKTFFFPDGSGPPSALESSLCTCVSSDTGTCLTEKGYILKLTHVSTPPPPNPTHYTHGNLKGLTPMIHILNINMWFFNCERKQTLDTKKLFIIHRNVLCMYVFIYREKEGREKERGEISMFGWLSHAPYWGPDPQPRHVPWLGIQPVSLWFQAHAQSTEPHQPGHRNGDSPHNSLTPHFPAICPLCEGRVQIKSPIW